MLEYTKDTKPIIVYLLFVEYERNNKRLLVGSSLLVKGQVRNLILERNYALLAGS